MLLYGAKRNMEYNPCYRLLNLNSEKMKSDKYIKHTDREMKNINLGDIREIDGELYVVDYWYYFYVGVSKMSWFKSWIYRVKNR